MKFSQIVIQVLYLRYIKCASVMIMGFMYPIHFLPYNNTYCIERGMFTDPIIPDIISKQFDYLSNITTTQFVEHPCDRHTGIILSQNNSMESHAALESSCKINIASHNVMQLHSDGPAIVDSDRTHARYQRVILHEILHCLGFASNMYHLNSGVMGNKNVLDSSLSPEEFHILKFKYGSKPSIENFKTYIIDPIANSTCFVDIYNPEYCHMYLY